MPNFFNVIRGNRPFSLMRWYSVLSLICIITASVLSSYVLSHFLTQKILKRDAEVTLEFVQSVADIENAKARAAGRTPDVRDRGMEELFQHFAGLPDILRSNIYATDRTLAWSSDKNIIGKRFDDNPELEKALKGEVEIETGTTGRSQHPKHEHMFLSDQPVPFVETYLPIRDRQTGKVIGVAELYRIPHALFATIQQGQRLIWVIAVLAAILLYLTLFWIVRRADTTIRDQQSRLIESETLATVGVMGSAVAHGIRNPLASIRSSAELCVDEKASAQVRESMADIVAQVDRLENWVSDLLSYSQSEARTAQSVPLDVIVKRACEHLARDFEKQRIVPSVSVPESVPGVVGDAAAYEQVFASVLANAMEAMPDGGRVTINANTPSRGEPVVVTVSDTGVGIPQNESDKLFKPFHTTKAKGMGLGLALVRRIVRSYGGDVRIESIFGKGTQVVLSFVASRS
jgi:signal transduction histidine kinase